MTERRLFGIVTFWMAAAIIPAAATFQIANMFPGVGLFLAMAVYFFAYRPVIATLRLLSLGVIEKKDAWKSLLPFWADRYRWYLWLG